jgi:hypothetical protein
MPVHETIPTAPVDREEAAFPMPKSATMSEQNELPH